MMSTARNAGALTVGGSSRPPDSTENVAGTRTFVAPPAGAVVVAAGATGAPVTGAGAGRLEAFGRRTFGDGAAPAVVTGAAGAMAAVVTPAGEDTPDAACFAPPPHPVQRSATTSAESPDGTLTFFGYRPILQEEDGGDGWNRISDA